MDIIGTIKLLTGGEKDLHLKLQTINFTDSVNKPDSNDDKMVTKNELQIFLDKNLNQKKQNKNPAHKQIISRVIKSVFGGSDDKIDTSKLISMMKNGIDFGEEYNDNTAFMNNTLGK